MKRKSLWLRRMLADLAPRRSLEIVKSDMLPKKLPRRNLTLARDGDEDWAVGLHCPCGCGRRLEMMVLKEVKPRWDVTVDRRGYVSLYPSVWVREGCKSHFWVRSGKIIWCD